MTSKLDLLKADGTVNIAKAGRFYTSQYLDEFFEAHREEIVAKEASANPLKLFVLYEDFIRGKVLEANPSLKEENYDGKELVHEARVSALVRRIMPEFPQFIASWLERFDAPLATPNVRRRRTTSGVVGEEGGYNVEA